MIEVLSVGDKFFMSLMQCLKDTKYVEAFQNELDAENIPYKVTGPFSNGTALVEIPK